MTKDWDIEYLKQEIDKISRSESDPRMDGFVTWGCKKDLYELLWYLEDIMDKCSSYGAVEQLHLNQRSKEINIKILKGEKT